MNVLYFDGHLLFVHKPAGLPTQAASHHKESLEDSAKCWVKNEKNKTGNVFLHAVHRLDRPVSGIVLFAGTSKALSRLNAAMRQREIKKTYFAILEGLFPHEEGSLEHYLIHDEYFAREAGQQKSGSKKALLSYKVLERSKGHTFVEIELHTGRYHQIRAQFSLEGYPILGDEKYGSRRKDGFIALHHGRMCLSHPVTKEAVDVVCPFPEAWNTLFSSLAMHPF